MDLKRSMRVFAVAVIQLIASPASADCGARFEGTVEGNLSETQCEQIEAIARDYFLRGVEHACFQVDQVEGFTAVLVNADDPAEVECRAELTNLGATGAGVVASFPGIVSGVGSVGTVVAPVPNGPALPSGGFLGTVR